MRTKMSKTERARHRAKRAARYAGLRDIAPQQSRGTTRVPSNVPARVVSGGLAGGPR